MAFLVKLLAEAARLGRSWDRDHGQAASLRLVDLPFFIPGSNDPVDAIGTVDQVGFHSFFPV